ncbi:hypothetical protein Tco_1227049 [Tanacetum coccineum]
MASDSSDRDAKDALSKLLQMGMVAEYQNEFEILINRVTGISQSLLTSFYISRLKLELQRELWRSRPTTLGEAFSLAHIAEARFEESVKNHFGSSKYEDPQGALSKLLQLGMVDDYQREFEKLMNRVTDIPDSLLISFYISGLKLNLQHELFVSRPTTLGDAFSLARITEAHFEAITEKEQNIKEKADTTLSMSSEEALPVVKGPLDDSKDTILSLRSEDLNFKIQEKVVEYVRALNVAPLEVVFAEPVDEVRGKFAEFSKDKGCVQKVLSATKLPEGGNSHSAYSPYHLEGKVIFKGVRNVTPWAADGGRRKKVKCYVQGSGRGKRLLVALLFAGVLFMASDGIDRDAKDAVSKLLQMGTVAEYQNEFEILVHRVTGISQSLLTSFYIFGLKLELQRELWRSRSTTLGEAFSVARIIEARFEEIDDFQREFKKLMNRVTGIPDSLLIFFYISGLNLNLQHELLVARPTTLGDAFFLARITEARFEAIVEKEQNIKEKADTTQSLPSEEVSPVVKGPLDASEDTLLSSQSEDLNFKIQEKTVEYVRTLNAAPLEVVFAEPVDEVRGKFAEFSKDKGCVEKVLSATKLPEGGNSHSAYSPYHLEGKVIFEGVGNITPWAADGGRRKKVKCYV